MSIHNFHMSLAESIIGWLAPPLCVGCGAEGRSLCAACAAGIQPYGERCFRCGALSGNYKTCQSCRRSGGPGKVFVVGVYGGVVRDLLRSYKFDQQRSIADSIARLMAELCTQSANPLSSHLIVPIPTATKRVRERGFDHSILLARKLSALLNFHVNTPLKRTGQSRQVGSVRTQRLKQMEGSFRVVNPQAVCGQSILLVDDVVTTGATITEASKTLRQAGAKHVDALVFAKRL